MQILSQLTEAQENIYTTKILDFVIPENNGEKPLGWVMIILERVGQDLRSLLVEGISFLTEEHVKVIMYNLLSATRFFHAAGVMHRDIKPANILVTE